MKSILFIILFSISMGILGGLITLLIDNTIDFFKNDTK